MDVHKTFGQTRSGTRDTRALGQDLPRIRTLEVCLYCCPQARLRTLPGTLGKRGNKGLQIQVSRQKRRVQITLHRPNPTSTLVPTQRQRLLERGTTAMTILRQSSRSRGDFVQDAARECLG